MYLWHKFIHLPVSSILGNFVKHLVVVLQENQLVHFSSDEYLHNLKYIYTYLSVLLCICGSFFFSVLWGQFWIQV